MNAMRKAKVSSKRSGKESASFESLRSAIEDIDRQIADLVARRMDVVVEIARAKSEMRLPIRDFRVEREVVNRMESRCRELGTDPVMGRHLARLLIQSAVRIMYRTT
jgi:chorismate mutase